MQEGLAQVRQFRVVNFQSIEDATLEFDSNNILNIIGFNDVGKSAITRALECLLYYKYPSAQKSFIRKGEKFFQVSATFEDGISVVLERHKDGNTSRAAYHMLDSEGKVIYSTVKQSVNSGKPIYEKVTGVPPEIQRYLKMGTFQIGGKLASLNSGNRYDPLLLVGTSGSDNTKALNSAMKSEELTEAHEALAKANNQLRGKINGKEQALSELREFEGLLRGLSAELVEALRGQAEETAQLEFNVELAGRSENTLTKLINHRVPPSVEALDGSKITAYSQLEGLLGKYQATRVPPSVEVVESGYVEELAGLEGTLLKLGVPLPPELHVLEQDELTTLGTAQKVLSSYIASTENLARTTAKLSELQEESKHLSESLKRAGMVVSYCRGCGELSILDKDGNHFEE